MLTNSREKVLSIETALAKRVELKDSSMTVGLCHGTFDFIHLGHIRHFKEASIKVDVLFCSITPDEFVIKGKGRPFYKQEERLEYLSEVSCIDFCLLNNEATAIDLINKLKPDLYIKGPDYTRFENDPTGNIDYEVNAVRDNGGEVYFTTGDKLSSTEIINKYSKEELL